MTRTAGPLLAALALLALCALAFLPGTGRLGLIEKDEPRYAGTAREMVRGGDWLVPRFNGRERLVKPPLTYWAMAASFRVTGRMDEASARLPSVVAGSLLVLLVAAGTGRALGRRWGVAAGAMLATSLLFTVEARLATTDMPFALFFTAAAACWVPVLEGSPRRGAWILLSGVAAGLAALTKTPLALLLPPVAALAAAVVLRRGKGEPAGEGPAWRWGALGTAAWFLGAAAVAAALFLPWAAAAEAATDGRLSAALREQVGARVDADRGVHPEPPWYFLAHLVPAAFPWSLLLPAGGVALLRERRAGGRPAVLVLFAATLAATVVAFFSLLPSKLISYLLPALPPLAVLAAAGLRAALEDPGGRAALLLRWVGGGGALLAAAAVAVAPAIPPLRALAGPEALADAAPALSLFAGLLGLGGMLLMAGRCLPGAATLALSVLAAVLASPAVYPHLEAARSSRAMGRALREAGLRPGDRLFDVTNDLTGIPWYADHATEPGGGGGSEGATTQDLLDALAAGGRVWAIVDYEPEVRHPAGRRTQWERILARRPPGVAPPRVVFAGMGRLVVTTAPP